MVARDHPSRSRLPRGVRSLIEAVPRCRHNRRTRGHAARSIGTVVVRWHGPAQSFFDVVLSGGQASVAICRIKSFVYLDTGRRRLKLKLLDTAQTAKTLLSLIAKHESIHVATAWATSGPVSASLLRQRSKFSNVIIGINGFVTEPRLLKKLIGIPNCYVAKAERGIFHPKLYYFESGTSAEAVVGSSNFTGRGLGANVEAKLHLKGATGDRILREIRDTIRDYAPLCRDITVELVKSYREQFEINKTKSGRTEPVLPNDESFGKLVSADLLNMSWAEFLVSVRADQNHSVDKRLKMLAAVRKMFIENESLANWPVDNWRAIGGLMRQSASQRAGLGDYEWGWFGSMRRAPDFAKLISARDPNLALALDAIPLEGKIEHEHFQVYLKHFRDAFGTGKGSNGLGTATRLLAMKRPDAFVCVDGPNKAGLYAGLSQVNVKLDTYWQKVIEPIRTAPWYAIDRPSRDGRMWDCRVALLDAIYYDPS